MITCRPDRVPAALRAYPHWVTWREEPRSPGDPRLGKIPYGRDGARAKANEPATWLTYDAARAAFDAGGWAGIGFFFFRALPFIGIDLDHCRDPGTGALEPWAAAVVRDLAGAYAEVSQSGAGVHIIVQGTVDFPDGRDGGKRGPIEMYAGRHYLALTGELLEGSGADVTPAAPEKLYEIARAYGFLSSTAPVPAATGPGAATPVGSQPTSDAPPPAVEQITDEALVAAIMRSPDARRWHTLYGAGELPHGSSSEADFELAAVLCRHSPDDDQVARLMESSPLARPKWNAKRGAETWLMYTIRSARARNSGRANAGDRVAGSSTAQSLAALLADPALLAPPAAVVPNMAWAGRLTLVAAREGIGKSTLFASAAAAVTRGADWLGAGRCACGPVLWCLIEEHVGDLARRAVGAGTDPGNLWVLDRPGDALTALRAEVARLRPVLIVIDTLHAWAAGTVTEASKADEWQGLVGALDDIARGSNAAVLMAAQASKQTGDYRDSTAIGHGVDVVLTLARPSDLPDDDPTRDLLVRKARWALPVVRYRYTAQTEGGIGTDYGLAGLTRLPPAMLDAVRMETVLAWVTAHPGTSFAQITVGVGGRKDNLVDAVNGLITSGKIVDRPTGKNNHHYYEAGAAPADADDPGPTDPDAGPSKKDRDC